MTNQSEFTPKPWVVTGTVIDGFVVREECSKVIVAEPNKYLIYSEANAHLIAAAPELYDVLQGFLEVYEYNKGYELMELYREKAHEVLAKARGENGDT